jgi:hypothetical protein
MGDAARRQSGHFHAVRFYKDAGSLAEIVCAFLAEGLTHGEPAVLIATAEHVEHFRRCFTSSGIDADDAITSGRLTILDAEETLKRFMHDGIPMAQPFAETISPVLRSVAARYPGVCVRAYGEMVDVLWRNGQTAAAIRLETLWNDLARTHDFKLLCGYAMGNFYKHSSTDEITGVHSHIVTDTGSRIPVA